MIQGKMQTTLNATLWLLQWFPLMPQCEILSFINHKEQQSHKAVFTHHNFWTERRAKMAKHHPLISMMPIERCLHHITLWLGGQEKSLLNDKDINHKDRIGCHQAKSLFWLTPCYKKRGWWKRGKPPTPPHLQKLGPHQCLCRVSSLVIQFNSTTKNHPQATSPKTLQSKTSPTTTKRTLNSYGFSVVGMLFCASEVSIAKTSKLFWKFCVGARRVKLLRAAWLRKWKSHLLKQNLYGRNWTYTNNFLTQPPKQ